MFTRCSARAAVLGLALFVCASPAPAQSNTGALYRLLKTSTYAEGCFGACECPVFFNGSLRGTFRLKLENIGDASDLYSVSNARFFGAISNTLTRTFTGSGTYKLMITGFNPNTYDATMDLTLAQPNMPTYDFNGGPTPAPGGGTATPPIDIAIDRNNQICYDQVLHIIARPMSPDWDLSGSITVQDLFAFLGDWFAGDPSACYSGGAAPGVQDIFDFLTDWFASPHATQ